MPRSFSITILGALVAMFGACNPSKAEDENCSLSAPPSDALVAYIDRAYYVFVYPRKPSQHYNGCQTVWIEKGKMAVGKFKDGVLIEIDTFEEDGSLLESNKCVYANGQPVNGDEHCPYYDWQKDGLQFAIMNNIVTSVPPDRDIRTKPQ